MANFTTIISFLRRYRQDTLYAAVSGGADSVALFHLLLDSGVAFEVVHFEHGMRGASSVADAEFVQNLCDSYQVPCRIIPLEVPQHRRRGENLEAAARRLRLRYYRKLTAETPNAVILLAHHLNDAVENMLLRLARGGNVSGITNLRKLKRINGVTLLRPLLDVKRSELETYLNNLHQPWRTDHTNADISYQRNYLRNKLLPEWQQAFGMVESGLTAALHNLEQDAEYIEHQADKSYEKIADLAETAVEFWQLLPEALLIRVLRRYWPDTEFTAGRVSECRKFLFFSADNARLNFTDGDWVRRGGTLIKTGANTELTPPDTIDWDYTKTPCLRCFYGTFTAEYPAARPGHWERNPAVAYFDAAKLSLPLRLTFRQGGETFADFSGHCRTVKQSFINAKIAPEAKRKMPLVYSGGNLVWLPLVSNTAEATVTEATQVLVKLTFEPAD